MTLFRAYSLLFSTSSPPLHLLKPPTRPPLKSEVPIPRTYLTPYGIPQNDQNRQFLKSYVHFPSSVLTPVSANGPQTTLKYAYIADKYAHRLVSDELNV